MHLFRDLQALGDLAVVTGRFKPAAGTPVINDSSYERGYSVSYRSATGKYRLTFDSELPRAELVLALATAQDESDGSSATICTFGDWDATNRTLDINIFEGVGTHALANPADNANATVSFMVAFRRSDS